MNGFDFESRLRPVGLAVDAPDQAITVQQWQAEIAELAQWFGHIAFNLVVVVEHFATALTLDHQIVKRRQDTQLCNAARCTRFQTFRVDVDAAVFTQRPLGKLLGVYTRL